MTMLVLRWKSYCSRSTMNSIISTFINKGSQNCGAKDSKFKKKKRLPSLRFLNLKNMIKNHYLKIPLTLRIQMDTHPSNHLLSRLSNHHHSSHNNKIKVWCLNSSKQTNTFLSSQTLPDQRNFKTVRVHRYMETIKFKIKIPTIILLKIDLLVKGLRSLKDIIKTQSKRTSINLRTKAEWYYLKNIDLLYNYKYKPNTTTL